MLHIDYIPIDVIIGMWHPQRDREGCGTLLWVGLLVYERSLVVFIWIKLAKVELVIFRKWLEWLLAVTCVIRGKDLARYAWSVPGISILIDLNFVERWLMADLCWRGLVCRMLCLLLVHRLMRLDIVLLHWLNFIRLLLLCCLIRRYHDLMMYLLMCRSNWIDIAKKRVLHRWRESSLAIAHATAVSLDIIVEDGGCV